MSRSNNDLAIPNPGIAKDEFAIQNIPFSRCIVVGHKVDESQLRADGDILLGTTSNTLLISEGKVYLNGVEQTTIDQSCIEVIRAAFGLIARNFVPFATPIESE